ncbi:Hsp70 family protein [Rubellicoccus peritrichatus]|uniref:Hsp70 family protein n=1 Tax=Rubellicoccus peritrichatus TaxID=3080537 RepID=A0AAQ3L5E9_9BACT|nr:Hsp70 family protein [Puniceicoccus sp. CR14]WOO39500.1 Hsp70 family protein [Puniceicoccus sp. CR14]
MQKFSFSRIEEGQIGIGVDFGTSNSSVAIFDGKELRCLTIEEGDHALKLIPTAIYISKDLLPTIGLSGIEQYLQDNRNRQIKLKQESVGAFDMTLGFGGDGDAQTITVQANAWTDQNIPGRLFRGIKSWLGNSDVDRVKIFNKSFNITALITPILLKLKETYSPFAESKIDIHVGRPVNFVGDSQESNRQAISRLTDSCRFAEIKNPIFCEEPVAAAMSFLHTHSVEVDSKYLVFDFGGGTLDLTVLSITQNGFSVLATGGIGLGGNMIDCMIYKKMIFPEIGLGVKVSRNANAKQEKTDFRFSDYAERLIDWQNAYQLNTPRLRNQINVGMKEGGEAEIKLKRLRGIIVDNLSYEILRAIESAKIELSNQTETIISVPGIDLEVPFTRQDFDEILKAPLKDIDTLLSDVLSKANVSKDELTGVVCTGGSSEIPAIRNHLEALLHIPIIRHDAFTGIAAGLAIANYYGYDSSST